MAALCIDYRCDNLASLCETRLVIMQVSLEDMPDRLDGRNIGRSWRMWENGDVMFGKPGLGAIGPVRRRAVLLELVYLSLFTLGRLNIDL
jgi:hypothetical protein